MLLENSQWIVLGIGAVALIAGLILVFLGFRNRKKLASMADTATLSAAEAARMAAAVPGARVELVGTVKTDQPLLSPTAQISCVYYRYKLEHRIERQERDSQGNWRTSEHWDTVEDRKEHVPFQVCDSSGECMVFPQGAEFVAETRTHEGYGSPYDSSSGGVLGSVVQGVLDAFDNETVRGYRITESVLRVGQPVYVLGTTQRSGEIASIGEGDGPFIISHKMEEELGKRYKLHSALQYAFGAILGIGGIVGMIYAVAFMAK
ncbi:MAG: hypothetical protein C4536_16325 [Actinobacteria bacterium]|jgi:hypothetical protein|nr:MAG: hypothetical protein C4536_16325 [Actinomycetota bacterium]